MPRSKSAYICEGCGAQHARWAGRCPSCDEWNTLVEVAQGPRDGRPRTRLGVGSAQVQELAAVSSEGAPRLATSSDELDRVLGGGLVPGSVVLIAGDPGIGKSTLLLRAAAEVAQRSGPVVYVSGEESATQIKLRADRLGIVGTGLLLLTTTRLDEVLIALERHSPRLVVVDSIQTVYDETIPAGAGTLVQVRECARRLLEWAKAVGVPAVLTGHVTKGGDIAGPRLLEHMVDVVLYMEGDPVSSWRLLRAVKNRFGSTNEVGVFEMGTRGLVDVPDPSQVLLSERSGESVGSVVVCTMEGTRPLLAEVQALTSRCVMPPPRRVTSGVDLSRLLLVCAVLGRRAGVPLGDQDVLVNVTGGLRIGEPAADLGIALAIASTVRNAPVDAGVAAVGEVGLSGEVRSVPQLERRVDEVARLGLRRFLVPASRLGAAGKATGVEVVPVASVAEALAACFGQPGGGVRPSPARRWGAPEQQ